MKVLQDKKIVERCHKYQIFKQYQKSCRYINLGLYETVDLKLLKSKSARVYQFRITKKFRALATKQNGVSYVFHISDHQ